MVVKKDKSRVRRFPPPKSNIFERIFLTQKFTLFSQHFPSTLTYCAPPISNSLLISPPKITVGELDSRVVPTVCDDGGLPFDTVMFRNDNPPTLFAPRPLIFGKDSSDLVPSLSDL